MNRFNLVNKRGLTTIFTKSSLRCIIKKATMIRANPYQSPCISSSGTKPGSAPGSRKRFRSISISENYPTNITHPHSYEGILKITRSSQTISGDLVGSPSLWSEKFKKKSTTASNKGPIIYFFDGTGEAGDASASPDFRG